MATSAAIFRARPSGVRIAERQLKPHVRDEKEVAGKVKRAVGRAVGNPSLQAEGAIDQVTGKVQKTVGHIQDRVEK